MCLRVITCAGAGARTPGKKTNGKGKDKKNEDEDDEDNGEEKKKKGELCVVMSVAGGVCVCFGMHGDAI